MFNSSKNFHKKILGAVGEKSAVNFLKKQGYKILEKNFKTRVGEIDIIAKDGEEIVFVEVKTRTSDNFGEPSEAVNHKKQEKYHYVAEQYLLKKGLQEAICRFDVIEVKSEQINHIKSAFFI